MSYKIEHRKTTKLFSGWYGRTPLWGEGKLCKVYPTFGMAQEDISRLLDVGIPCFIRPAGPQTMELNRPR